MKKILTLTLFLVYAIVLFARTTDSNPKMLLSSVDVNESLKMLDFIQISKDSISNPNKSKNNINKKNDSSKTIFPIFGNIGYSYFMNNSNQNYESHSIQITSIQSIWTSFTSNGF